VPPRNRDRTNCRLAATVFRNRAREGRKGWCRGRERGGVPVSLVVQHGVENNEQLAYAGGERGLGVLSAGTQPQIESSDGGIATDSRHCRHIQDAPDLRASAPDTTAAAQFSTIAINGASPARAAICLRLSIPSSGRCASRVLESTLPTPGAERSNSSRSRHRGVSRINAESSSSRPESRFSSQGQRFRSA
jgi:hypothetical protein